jgi:putative drug exporter of the RND superfamily
MRAILKSKWVILIAWIAIIAGLFFAAPNMENLVREKGQISVPDGYSSTIAEKILSDVNSSENKGNELQTALVFHSDKKLTEEEIEDAQKGVGELEKNKKELGITSILTHFNQKELKEQLVSEDGKTILVSVNVTANGREGKEISEDLYQTLDSVKVDHYYTGSWLIGEDLVTNSQEGLKKTEGITVVFILIVLLLVFKSAVAPIIPLVTVGFSYLASQSIVAILVDKVNFPLSTFTQIFLVAVLFGIGTDYCILLLSRFKEEMSKTDSVADAIIETYRNAGKTVFFSGLAVMIGFASIGLSTFVLYQSAAAVAIGVAILLLALFTVVPFFMAVLGKKLFWPSKGKLDHGESKIWGFAGKFALARPLIALIIVGVISVPFLFTYDGELSFNSLEEISDDFDSIKGFDIISEAFGPGESMPTTIVIKNDDQMNTSEYIAITEKISQELEKINGVDTVRSVTRPTGEPIDDLYISNQVKALENGLSQSNDGIQQISDGLTTNIPKMQQATDGISQLISGTNELQTGIGTISENLTKIEDGLGQSSIGTTQIRENLKIIKTKSAEVLAGSKELLAGYNEASTGLNTLKGHYDSVAVGLDMLNESLLGTKQYFDNLEGDYSDIEQNQYYQAIKMTIQGSQKGTAEIAANLKVLNAELKGAQEGINFANSKFSEAIAGQEALIKGMEDLINGIKKIEDGLIEMENGQGRLINEALPQFSGGLSGVNNGQQQILDGFKDTGDQLSQVTDGLNEISNGLVSAQDYLSGVAKMEQNGFYIPQDVLDSKDFEQSLDAYMSKNRKVMTIDVVFDQNPYSKEVLDSVPEITETVERVVKDTKLENADVAVGGVSSMHKDLDTISEADYSRTVVLMLIGISIILIILFRSIIMPLYLIGSLVLTYFTSMAIAEVIFVNILGYSGISWAVPFFAFVILVALGIDYSIFLMDRFNEFRHMPVEQAILISMKKMGTVIISAAIILGGTFAAMMPSGVLSLLQIATILLIGLSLYALVILPLFVPVMVKTFGEANWWPFRKNKDNVMDDSIHM